MKPEQLRVHNILLDTIRLLCKNSLPFNQSLRIEGVIGITTDSSDVFLVHINETFGTILKEETSREASFGLATPVKQPHTVSAPPFSQQQYIEKDLTPVKLANFSFRSPVTQSFSNNDESLDMPVLHKVEATRSNYKPENLSSISSAPATQSCKMSSNDGMQSEGNYYEEDGQEEYGEQQDYKTGEEQGMWTTTHDSQSHYLNANQQNAFMSPPKLPSGVRTNQAMRAGGRGGGARVCKVGRGCAPKSANFNGQQNHMSPGGEPNELVVSKSTLACGYPDCPKTFTSKQGLLRHQTNVHGREPRKRNTPTKASHSSSLLNEEYSSGMMESDHNEGMDNSNNYEQY